MLRSATCVSAVIIHKAEGWAALQSQKPSDSERRNESVMRIGGPRLAAGFLLSMCQLARLQRIAPLFANPLFGNSRKRLRAS